jgi:hypothetical protein
MILEVETKRAKPVRGIEPGPRNGHYPQNASSLADVYDNAGVTVSASSTLAAALRERRQEATTQLDERIIGGGGSR